MWTYLEQEVAHLREAGFCCFLETVEVVAGEDAIALVPATEHAIPHDPQQAFPHQ